jgi:hypothetical protein
MTRDKIDQLWNRALGQSINAGEAVTRYHFAALVLEEAAQGCEDLIDKKEEARAALRAAKAIESGDEGDMLAALKHESNVNLYGVGISNCIKAIRAMKPEVK